jgi:hypothetical protein
MRLVLLFSLRAFADAEAKKQSGDPPPVDRRPAPPCMISLDAKS